MIFNYSGLNNLASGGVGFIQHWFINSGILPGHGFTGIGISGPGRKSQKVKIVIYGKLHQPYFTLLWCTQVTKNTQEYSYTNRYTGALQLWSSPNQPVCLLWYRYLPTRRSIKTDNNNSLLARYKQNTLDNSLEDT